MDLRPHLADQFITAILADLREHGSADEEALRERWRALIVERFVSDSIDMPEGRWTSTYQPDVVDAFLAKYPKIEPVLEYIRFALREIWPDVRILLEVNSDPEGCHTCREGQHITVQFYSKIGDAEEDAADQSTREWSWSPQALRERKYEELMFEGGLHALAPQDIRDLVCLSRGYGDPDEALGAEARYVVEYEKRRRERAEREMV